MVKISPRKLTERIPESRKIEQLNSFQIYFTFILPKWQQYMYIAPNNHRISLGPIKFIIQLS